MHTPILEGFISRLSVAPPAAAGDVVPSPGLDPVRELVHPCVRREKRVDSDGKERYSLVAWLINPPTTKRLSLFTAVTPDSLACSVACWSTQNDLLTSGRRRLVSTSLFYPNHDTTTPRSA